MVSPFLFSSREVSCLQPIPHQSKKLSDFPFLSCTMPHASELQMFAEALLQALPTASFRSLTRPASTMSFSKGLLRKVHFMSASVTWIGKGTASTIASYQDALSDMLSMAALRASA